MKQIPFTFFKSIHSAYLEDTAASEKWVKSELKKLQLYFLDHQLLQINQDQKITSIYSFHELIDFLKTEGFSFSFNISNVKSFLEKIAYNLKHQSINKIEIETTNYNTSAGENINIDFFDKNNSGFYIGFKNVISTNLPPKKNLSISNVIIETAIPKHNDNSFCFNILLLENNSNIYTTYTICCLDFEA